MVETHKVPILKKLGWYLDLKKRGQHKPLPNWMISAKGLNRVKDNKYYFVAIADTIKRSKAKCQ
jgi:hypothetical protein